MTANLKSKTLNYGMDSIVKERIGLNRARLRILLSFLALGACQVESRDLGEGLRTPSETLDIKAQNTEALKNLTRLGLEVEESAKGVVIYLPPSVRFKSKGTEISLQARDKIFKIADEVNKEYLRSRKVEVAGHSDSIGSAARNMRISRLRAEAVLGELIFSNVKSSRIELAYLGETKLRAKDVDAQGNVDALASAMNRRVEFTILNPS